MRVQSKLFKEYMWYGKIIRDTELDDPSEHTFM